MPRKSFYALAPPDTFGTQHHVYVKLKTTRNGEQWTIKPLRTGRTVESARCKPDILTTARLSHSEAMEYRQRPVDKTEAESGAGTYLHAYICAAPAPRHVWCYGVVIHCDWSVELGGRLIVDTDDGRLSGRLVVSVSDETLHAVTVAGYALRPFHGLPMAPDLDAFKKTLKELVARFLTSDRHAHLDVSELPLDCSSWTQPPDATCLWCIFDDMSVGKKSARDILDFAHAQYQANGDESAFELPAPRDLTLLHWKCPRSASDDDLLVESTAKKRIRTNQAPDLLPPRVSITKGICPW